MEEMGTKCDERERVACPNAEMRRTPRNAERDIAN
jgi:hypothetical protein